MFKATSNMFFMLYGKPIARGAIDEVVESKQFGKGKFHKKHMRFIDF